MKSFEVQRDVSGAPCAACGQAGDYRGKRTLVAVEGIPLMLCINPNVCRKRWSK